MEFRLLGPLEVRVDDRLVRVRGAKERALLALLLLEANRPVSRDRLVDELWGDDPPAQATNSLQVRLSNLRKALASASEPGAADVVVSGGGGYAIRLEHEQLDLHRFEGLLAEADDAFERRDAAAAAELLRDALALWRGPALADFASEPFAQIPAARLEELRLLALEKRIDAELALGRHAELVAELEALVGRHPHRERLCGQLMLALYRSGRQAESLVAYRRLRRALVEELGIEPSPLLQELERRVLRQSADLDLAGMAASERSVLLAVLEEGALGTLLEIGTTLARRPRHELVVVRPVAPGADLARANADLNERRAALLRAGVAARTASFASAAVGADLVRIVSEQDVDLLLVAGRPEILDDAVQRALLEAAPCDVAVVLEHREPLAPGPVLVPFTGSEHDWAAVELGAWMAAVWESPLRLAGAAADPGAASSDASRVLAHAALAAQRALGVATEPVLVAPTADGLVRAADESALLVVGIPGRWRQEGLGTVRLELVRRAQTPTLLVRRGLRPGGLAPRESLTRFTWSVGPGSSP